MPHTILIVEDQGIASAGVKFILSTREDYRIVAEAGSLKKARELLAREKPDILILDVFLPDGLGLDLLKEIRREDAQRPGILLYSGQAIPQEFAAALQLGANALLSKADPPEELLIALNHIAHGHQYLSVSVKSKLAVGFNGELTLREQQVLQLLSQGLDNRRIAAKLNVSPATVKKHRENILSKLDVPNTSAAVSMGLRKRIIDVGGR